MAGQQEIRAKLGFYFEIPDWLPRDLFKLLMNYGDYKRLKGKTIFFMPLANFNQVQELMPRMLNLEQEEAEKLVETFPLLGVQMELLQFKGKSGYEVIEHPDYYELISWRKTKEDRTPKQQVAKVPKQHVALLWSVLERIPKGQVVSCKTIAKNVCEKLGIERFHRQSGSFDWSKFYGTRNHRDHGYFTLYNDPLKVLEYHGAVKHSSSGKLARMADRFATQARIQGAGS